MVIHKRIGRAVKRGAGRVKKAVKRVFRRPAPKPTQRKPTIRTDSRRIQPTKAEHKASQSLVSRGRSTPREVQAKQSLVKRGIVSTPRGVTTAGDFTQAPSSKGGFTRTVDKAVSFVKGQGRGAAEFAAQVGLGKGTLTPNQQLGVGLASIASTLIIPGGKLKVASKAAVKAVPIFGKTLGRTVAEYQAAAKTKAFFDKTILGAISGKVANTKAVRLSKNILKKIGFKTSLFLVVTALGTYPFAKFELAEAVDKIGIAMFSAQKAGELDLVLEMADIIDEMSDPNLIDQVLHLIPGANVYNAARINGEKAVVSAGVFREIAMRELERQENGETESQMWERRKAEERELEAQDILDSEERFARYNENRIIAAEKAENAKDARIEARWRKDEERWKKIINANEARNQAARDTKEEFEAEVRAAWNKAFEESRPSNLNFGLLK